MKSVEIDDQGNVIDKETRQIVAKKVNGQIVPIANNNQPRTIEDRLRGTNVGQAFIKTNEEHVEDKQQEVLKPSSIKKEITKYEVKKDSVFYIHFCLLDKDERIIVIPVSSFDDFHQCPNFEQET